MAEQLAKIRSGQAILQREGLETDVWMAPRHGYDEVTLQALVAAGFGAITDGVGLYPWKYRGLTFVPQQLSSPRRAPLGIWTIKLHLNRADIASRLTRIRKRLESGARVIPFSEARKCRPLWASLANAIFRALWRKP